MPPLKASLYLANITGCFIIWRILSVLHQLDSTLVTLRAHGIAVNRRESWCSCNCNIPRNVSCDLLAFQGCYTTARQRHRPHSHFDKRCPSSLFRRNIGDQSIGLQSTKRFKFARLGVVGYHQTLTDGAGSVPGLLWSVRVAEPVSITYEAAFRSERYHLVLRLKRSRNCEDPER